MEIVTQEGYDALNARSVAKKLGCSTQPLFSLFNSMEEIKGEILLLAHKEYVKYVSERMGLTDKPYKDSGLAYLHFAKEKKELFKLLFMRGRTAEELKNAPPDESMDKIMTAIMEKTGYSYEQALNFHYHLWFFIHGLAAMMVTDYLQFTDEQLDALLTEEFLAMQKLYDDRL